MVWLPVVQNCRSIKCLQFFKPPELRRGAWPPLGPFQGSAYDPLGDIKRSTVPSPTHAPLTTNPDPPLVTTTQSLPRRPPVVLIVTTT